MNTQNSVMTARSCIDELGVILKAGSLVPGTAQQKPIARVGQLIAHLQSGSASASQKLKARKALTGFTELFADKRSATGKQRARQRGIVDAAISDLKKAFP
jgi:hypothetical protein